MSSSRALDQEFESFCRQHYPAVYRAALLLSSKKEIAEDATQEAFGRAFARWGRLSHHNWAAGWVMTTALNLCRRQLRDSKRSGLGAGAPDEVPGPTPERPDLLSALHDLPLRQRQAVILHYFGDFPVHAVADLMNLTDGTVKSYLFRARTAMEKSLAVSDDPTRAIRPMEGNSGR